MLRFTNNMFKNSYLIKSEQTFIIRTHGKRVKLNIIILTIELAQYTHSVYKFVSFRKHHSTLNWALAIKLKEILTIILKWS